MTGSGHEPLAHIDAIERLHPAARMLVPAEAAVDADVLGHQRVCIQLDLRVPAPPRLGLEERHQAPPDSLPLAIGIDRDVVEQKQVARALDHHQQAGHAAVDLEHPRLAVGDAARIIVEHWPRLLPEPLDVGTVAALDQRLDGGPILGAGGTDLFHGA